MKVILLNLNFLIGLIIVSNSTVLQAQTFHVVNGPMGVVNAFSESVKGNIYLASETRGVYVSNDKAVSWKKLGGNTIGVGEIDAICYSDSGNVIIATQQGGIKFWNGNAWINLNNGLAKTGNLYPSFKTIVTDLNGHYYAGAYGYNTQRGGAYYYDGISWTNISSTLADTNIYCMAVSPAGKIYAGTDGSGVFSYNGSTWSPENSSLGNLHINCLSFNKDGDLFAGTKAGVFSLSPGSSIWKSKGASFNLSVLSIAFDPTQNGRIFIGLGTQLFDKGALYGDIKRSDDNGDTWINSGFNFPTLRMAGMLVLQDGTILAGAQGTFKSEDHGSSWVKSNTGFDAKISNFLGSGLAFNSKSDLFYGSNYGVFKSPDEGQTWQLVNNGLTLPLVSCLAVDPLDNLLAGAVALRKGYILALANLYRSTDNGMQWDTVKISNDDSYTAIDFSPKGDYFCTHGFGANPPSATIIGSSIAISKDQGKTWQDLNVANAGKGFSVAINSKGHIFYGGEINGVYRSTDGGQSWVQNTDPAIAGNIAPMAISPQDDIFTCGYGLHHIFYSDSTTAGMPFTNIVDASFPDYTGASSFIFDDYGKLYTGTRGGTISGLYTATPPWSANTKFTANASVGPVRVVTMKWDKQGYLWLLSNGFLMKSDSILKFDPKLTSLNNQIVNSEFQLKAYPNPFNSETTIEFEILNKAETTLILYDENASLLKRILDAVLIPGSYKYNLGDIGLTTGVYWLELRNGAFNKTVKLIHK